MKPYIAALVIAFAAIFFYLFIRGYDTTEDYSKNFISFNDDWTVTEDGTDHLYDELPNTIQNSEEGIVYTKILPKGLKSYSTLCFYTCNKDVYAYLDGIEIYECTSDDYSLGNTTGNEWNYIPIYATYAGRSLEIHIIDSYGKTVILTPDFQLGDKEAIIGSYTKTHLAAFFVSVIMFLFGLMTIAGGVILRKTLHLSKGILWLGLAAITISIWSLMETQILNMYIGSGFIYSMISYLSQKLIAVPILCFLCFLYERENDKIANILCGLSIVDFLITTLLQLMDRRDYKQTTAFGHILFLIVIVYIMYMTVCYWKQKRKEHGWNRRFLVVNLFAVPLECACIVLDEVNYYFDPNIDAARFSRIGLMAYLVVMMAMIIMNSIHLIQMGELAEQIKEEALTDPLTKVLNRMAYENEVSRLTNGQVEGYGIAMFDLNNLKKFNDKYGHNMGDSYIILSSEILVDIFQLRGKIYRIGGDEFTAILHNVTEEQFDALEELMTKKAEILSKNYFYGNMEIAAGYSIYKPKEDGAFLTAARRADQRMYEKKAYLKEEKVASDR